jgi:hypothetical protein
MTNPSNRVPESEKEMTIKAKKSYDGLYHGTVNLYHIHTLSGHVAASFATLAEIKSKHHRRASNPLPE